MRIVHLALATVIVLAIYCLVAGPIQRELFPCATVSSDFLSSLAVIISVIVVYFGYIISRSHERQTLGEKMRSDFLNCEKLARIRMLIEHNDIELQTVSSIACITSPHHYESETLPTKYWNLVRDMDDYLDFLDGVAILYQHGDLLKESVEGLWAYYATRLARVDTLDHEARRIKLGQVEQSFKSIYAGHPPEYVQRAWDDAVRRYGDCATASDEDALKCMNPLERPIWCYVNQTDYQYGPLVAMVSTFFANESGTKKRRKLGRPFSRGDRRRSP